jgi:hypothetical protein
MLGFFRRQREAAQRQREAADRTAILTECEHQLERLSGTLLWVVDDQQIVSLVDRAASAGLHEHDTLKRLKFLHRLVTCAIADTDPIGKDALLAEADHLGYGETPAARDVRRSRKLELLHERGPEVMGHDASGRPVYFECEAEFKNRPGKIVMRDDGLTFVGEVVVDVEWTDAVHVARATHSYRGDEYSALALQEGKRRTPTKFALMESKADYACAMAVTLWNRARTPGQARSSTAPSIATSPTPQRSAPSSYVDPPAWDDAEFGYLGAVGESHYQDALSRTAAAGRVCWATLVPEPENPFDSNAVMVQIRGETVGYLSRTEARRYQRRLLALEQPLQIPAKIIGGAQDKPSFGVLLDCRAAERLPKPKRARKPSVVEPTDQPF